MKGIISIFLLITICSQIIVKISVLISWKLNQDFVIETLCVNRDKPEMECNGKCHLQKQWNKVDTMNKNEKDAIPNKLIILKTDDFVKDIEFNLSLFAPLNYVTEFYPSTNLYSFNYINSCFHPPQG